MFFSRVPELDKTGELFLTLLVEAPSPYPTLMNTRLKKTSSPPSRLSLREPVFAYPVRLYHQAWLARRITTAELALLCNPEALLTLIRDYERLSKLQPVRPAADNPTLRQIAVSSLAIIGGLTLTFAGSVGLLIWSHPLDYTSSSVQTPTPRQAIGGELAALVFEEVAGLYTPTWLGVNPQDELDLVIEPYGVRVRTRNSRTDIYALAQLFRDSGYTVSELYGNSLLITAKTVYY